METKTRTFSNGKTIKYKLTRERGFFTSHIWVYRDEKPWLHFMPSGNEGFTKCFKNCGKYGYLPMGEVAVPFDQITLNRIYLG